MIFLLSFSLLAGKVIIINETESDHLLETSEGEILIGAHEKKELDVHGITSIKINGKCYKASNEEGITKIIIKRGGKIETQIINR